MNQEPPSPPEELKPWYYQYWFLYPVIVFWPVWPVLILRSPWHNGLVSGAVAWAMLIIVGGYLIGWQQLYQTGELNQFTTTIIIPGLMLTVLTQVFWIRDKKRLREANREDVARGEGPPTDSPVPGQSRRSRNRRRSPRSGRSGRSSRGR